MQRSWATDDEEGLAAARRHRITDRGCRRGAGDTWLAPWRLLVTVDDRNVRMGVVTCFPWNSIQSREWHIYLRDMINDAVSARRGKGGV